MPQQVNYRRWTKDELEKTLKNLAIMDLVGEFYSGEIDGPHQEIRWNADGSVEVLTPHTPHDLPPIHQTPKPSRNRAKA